MADQEDTVRQFVAITGSNEDRARFFLESSAGNVEMAIARYYETEADEAVEDNSDVEIIEKAPEKPKKTNTRAASKTSNLHTLNTLAQSSDDEEEEGQAYYAGGSETSGQQVLGPPKGHKVISDMYKSIDNNGVEKVKPGASGSSKVFKGTGYKLGQEKDDTVVIPGASEPQPARQVTLRMWADGFSVNDGDLRPYDDENNKKFLESVKNGHIPQELREGSRSIDLAIENHAREPYRRLEKRGTKVFHGQGYTLGSPTPPVVGATTEEDKPVNEAKAKEALNVNSSEPVTNLQIRLADGSRLLGEFNHQHTIGNVRNFITLARPQYQALAFNLLSTYPSKVLDDSQTLKEAGLLNAAIMQKLI